MSNKWNTFRMQNSGRGYSVQELSHMYREQSGGDTQLIAQSIATHSNKLIELGKAGKDLYNKQTYIDAQGKRRFRNITSNDIKNLKDIASKTHDTYKQIVDTHSKLKELKKTSK